MIAGLLKTCSCSLISETAGEICLCGVVYDVTEDAALLYDDVRRFKAGSPNTAGAVGLDAALDFRMDFDRAALCGYEKEQVQGLTAILAVIEAVS